MSIDAYKPSGRQFSFDRTILGFDPKGCYAVTVSGDCLDPVISDGDLLIVSSTAEAEPDDFVFLSPANGAGPLVKRFVWGWARVVGPGLEVMPLIEVAQSNPPKTWQYRTNSFRAIHKVMASLTIHEPGWQGDGTYLFELDSDYLIADEIKVMTKKGKVRKEPRGRFRYSKSLGAQVQKVDIRRFAGNMDRSHEATYPVVVAAG